MTYPIFGRSPNPLPRLAVEKPKKRDAELNSRWSRFRDSYLRKNPFCAECARHGLDVPADVVDHIVPRRQGGSLFDRANLESLCNACHAWPKRDLERLAAEAGNVHLLVVWMERPETRPGRYAFSATTPEE
jgi:hypothetical protein